MLSIKNVNESTENAEFGNVSYSGNSNVQKTKIKSNKLLRPKIIMPQHLN